MYERISGNSPGPLKTGTLMSRMESCTKQRVKRRATGRDGAKRSPPYPSVWVVQRHEDHKDVGGARRLHGCHHALLALQEQPPAVGHDEQQLGRL